MSSTIKSNNFFEMASTREIYFIQMNAKCWVMKNPRSKKMGAFQQSEIGIKCQSVSIYGAGGENRTHTGVKPAGF